MSKLALILLVPLLLAPSRQTPSEVRLVRQGYVTNQSNPGSNNNADERDRFSMGGVAYEEGYSVWRSHGDNVNSAYLVFKVPPGMRAFRADFGVDDERGVPDPDEAGVHEPGFVIYLDGERVKSGALRFSQKPTHADLPLGGARSLKIELVDGAGVGDPVLSKADVPVSGGSAAPTPSLLAPDDGGEVSGSATTLRWSAILGARGYAVEIVCTSLAEDAEADTPRIWARTVAGTSLRFDVSNLRPGRYRWTVLAFGGKRTLGGFGKERSFVVR